MNRIDRLFALLLLLQVKRRLTAREIAAHFEITERTVYRDMKALSEMGIPVAAQAGEGYHLLETFSLPPVAFTEGEAKAITMAAR
ncbi:MAG: HTH domain-containing protein [Pleurocapsa minor GSE-CHR-MK-17-07R]|jgi:predicted DNA-binding transcriptional regulator YafY|nr:HTH domain-containing protein [Pleurocapsa minor GSE-CHR-MK 17-07R]